MRVMVALAMLLVPLQSPRATAQTDSTPSTPLALSPRAVPFGAGERMEYVVRWGKINPGRGSMEIVGVEDVRGRPAVHTRFQLKGRALFFTANYLLESWVDQATFTSLRFSQDNDDDNTEKDRVYEIFPERQTYRPGDTARG